MFDIQYLNYAFGSEIREAIDMLIETLFVIQLTLAVGCFAILSAVIKSMRHK